MFSIKSSLVFLLYLTNINQSKSGLLDCFQTKPYGVVTFIELGIEMFPFQNQKEKRNANGTPYFDFWWNDKVNVVDTWINSVSDTSLYMTCAKNMDPNYPYIMTKSSSSEERYRAIIYIKKDYISKYQYTPIRVLRTQNCKKEVPEAVTVVPKGSEQIQIMILERKDCFMYVYNVKSNKMDMEREKCLPSRKWPAQKNDNTYTNGWKKTDPLQWTIHG